MTVSCHKNKNFWFHWEKSCYEPTRSPQPPPALERPKSSVLARLIGINPSCSEPWLNSYISRSPKITQNHLFFIFQYCTLAITSVFREVLLLWIDGKAQERTNCNCSYCEVSPIYFNYSISAVTSFSNFLIWYLV